MPGRVSGVRVAGTLVPALYTPVRWIRLASRVPSWRARFVSGTVPEPVGLEVAHSSTQRTEEPLAAREGWREAHEGVEDERGTGTGWDAQGRVRADVGRQAGAVGRQWTPPGGLGDLPPEGVSRRPELPVRVPHSSSTPS